MAKLITKTYGDAVFELAVEEGKLEAMLEETLALLGLLRENPEYISLLASPRIALEGKLATLEEIFRGRISPELFGLIRIIVVKGRSDALAGILAYVSERMKEEKGIGTAYVSTPQSLAEDMKERIRARLVETTSFTGMEVHYRVEPALLGGMRIRMGDRVVDSSIRTKLDRLQKELMSPQISG